MAPHEQRKSNKLQARSSSKSASSERRQGSGSLLSVIASNSTSSEQPSARKSSKFVQRSPAKTKGPFIRFKLNQKMAKVCLVVIDGWGISDEKHGNAIANAKTPIMNKYSAIQGKYITLDASGEAVGLPAGLMGNSEVGHLNIGAGRVMYQDILRINKDCRSGSVAQNSFFIEACQRAIKNEGRLHLLGLVSDGGVHSHIEHLFAMLDASKKLGVPNAYVHFFADGRDTPPRSSISYMKQLASKLKDINYGKIATVMGRYYAMDRDKRWERIKVAYDGLVDGEGDNIESPTDYSALFTKIEERYASNQTDEFLTPIIVNKDGLIKDNDTMLFFNFRADRMRQITETFGIKLNFEPKTKLNNIEVFTMNQYKKEFPFKMLYPPIKPVNVLAEAISKAEIQQFHCAETEKYAHVTFFFNGGQEAEFAGEVRKMVASPKVATYDLEPKMNASGVCDEMIKAIEENKYQFVMCNFAPPDMVGHTGKYEETIVAVEETDMCIGRLAECCERNNYILLVTADHGNAERMIDEKGGPVTSHTTNRVPFIMHNSEKNFKQVSHNAALCDVAPTVLKLMNIPKPAEMDGQPLNNGKSISRLNRDGRDDMDESFRCEWSYLQFDKSLIAFSINGLSLIDRNNITDVQEVDEFFTEGYGSIEATDFALTEISLNATSEELLTKRLDPNLPFIFFINGFNTLNQEGEVNGTWMYDVAKNFARRGLQRRRNHRKTEIGANVVFLTWGIPHIFVQNALALVPAYYKTMANYDAILRFVSKTIKRLIKFVDDSRARQGGWKSEQERYNYYSRFEFYGHSLGSHIITDAINRVHRSYGNQLKFGKLMGLDPAMPCFMSLGHRLTGNDDLNNSTKQVVVLHSNAGLAGLTSERANIEIVLNGGTFQPGCSWFDFSCHHSRSTDIFRYMDDRCQMVAYKCSSYHHFKSGACETCDFDPASADNRQSDTYGENCVLVNMPEQHEDTNQIIEFVNQTKDDDIRQLASEDADFDLESLIINESTSSSEPTYTIKSPILLPRFVATGRKQDDRHIYYHYVNTSPNFRQGRKTHCLQHYQIRAMVLQDDIRTKQKCPISSYLDGDIRLRLFHEKSSNQQSGGIKWQTKRNKRQTTSGEALKSSPVLTLSKVIKDSLYTSLLNFEGSPELFIGAEISDIKFEQLSDCLIKNNATEGPNLVLDIAFMSHIDRRFRHAFSSILCGDIKPLIIQSKNGTMTDSQTKLMLKLCKQSELAGVSNQIDKLLDHIEQQRLNDSWQVSLLNSLFSLFVNWEPF